MGVYDLPASIDYILARTRQRDLFYIGHSMGTTMFYVMASVRPEYNAKIRLMISLSPVAYMGHIKSTVFRVLYGPLGVSIPVKSSDINRKIKCKLVYTFAESTKLGWTSRVHTEWTIRD